MGASDSATEGAAGAPESDSSDVDDVPDVPESRPDVPPEPPPTCCGCLCADPAWSCSEDTCITEAGHALDLAPEAGFLEILPGTRWLATNAAHDQVVYAPAFPVTLGTDYPDLVEHLELQDDAFVLHTTDGAAHRVEFPHYADSGHAVSAYEPAKLAADVRAFLDRGD